MSAVLKSRLTTPPPIIYKPGTRNAPLPDFGAQAGPANQIWYVVQCLPNMQAAAGNAIESAGLTAYCPTVMVKREATLPGSRSRRMAQVVEPLLGPYIFATWEPGAEWQRITKYRDGVGMQGVLWLLRDHAGRPRPVRELRVQELIAEQAERLKPHQNSPERQKRLKPGTIVTVAAGAFVRHTGTVLACDGWQTQVEIGIFGRLVTAWVDRKDLDVR